MKQIKSPIAQRIQIAYTDDLKEIGDFAMSH